jgi:hypothetical protein
MFRGRGLGACLASSLVVASLPLELAHAHGQRAAINDVVAADAAGPWLLKLTEGLAFRSPEGWRFVCPALVGLESVGLLAAAGDGAAAWLGGADDLYRIDRDGAITAEQAPELTGNFVIALGAAGAENALYALELVEQGSQLLRLVGPGTDALWADALEWQSIASFRGELLLGYAFETRLELAALSHDGELLRRSSMQLEEPAFSVSLRPAGDRLFAAVDGAAGSVLLELTEAGQRSLLTAPLSVDGPVVGDDGVLWASANGELFRVGVDTLEPVTNAPETVCVGQSATTAYGSTRARTAELTASGPGAVVFDLAQLQPPKPELHAASSSARCDAQWQLFRGDLQRAGLVVPDAEPVAGVPEATPAGCSLTPERRGRSITWLAATGWLLLIWTRRRRGQRGQRGR